MARYLVGNKELNDKQIYIKAKKLNSNIYGTQQALEYLKRRRFKIKFYNTSTKRWNLV